MKTSQDTATPPTAPAGHGPAGSRPEDIASLDDPEFLAARAQVRGQHEQEPADTRLANENERMTAEFDRRARAAWQAGAA